MLAQIIDGKLKKGHPDRFQGPFTPGAEIIWLPDEFLGLLENKLEQDFVYPDDPRISMDTETLALVNSKTNDYHQKPLEIETLLPSWSEVESTLNSIANLAEAKVALKRIARVVYLLARKTLN
jgi:hypothetical protein